MAAQHPAPARRFEPERMRKTQSFAIMLHRAPFKLHNSSSMSIIDIPNDPLGRVIAPYGAGLAELALAVGGLAIGTGEFASMAILPVIAEGREIGRAHV